MSPRGAIGIEEQKYNAEISRRVERLRAARKVGAAALARAAGVSPERLYNYEVGASRWPVLTLRRIADFFGVEVDALMPEPNMLLRVDCAQRDSV